MKITLKAARVNRGLTQEETAEKLSVSRRTIQNWEEGKSFPNAEKIKEIEKLFEVSYNDIIFLPTSYA